ncbi:hypothetical protein [Streptomyces racemochromogenes]|uniref:hypothetical protein n=1 Tax=Streptomyces racemochromogenes TaxID=67353 RepID=UPI0031E503B7
MTTITTQTDDETEPIPATVLTAAPGQFVTTPDEFDASRLIVWRNREYAGVIFDEGDMPRGRFAAWSSKAGTRNGIVGFFPTIAEAEAAVRALYPAPVPVARPFYARTFSATTRHIIKPDTGNTRTLCGHGVSLPEEYVTEDGTVERPAGWMIVDLPPCKGCERSAKARNLTR